MGFAPKMLWRELLLLVLGRNWVSAAGSQPWQLGTRELTAAITAQQTRAKECGGSKHAHACPPGGLMIFEQTMFGYCSPVGCFDSPEEGVVQVMSGSTVDIDYITCR